VALHIEGVATPTGQFLSKVIKSGNGNSMAHVVEVLDSYYLQEERSKITTRNRPNFDKPRE
jgi:hypothetical protein